jgi:hypothetical protein
MSMRDPNQAVAWVVHPDAIGAQLGLEVRQGAWVGVGVLGLPGRRSCPRRRSGLARLRLGDTRCLPGLDVSRLVLRLGADLPLFGLSRRLGILGLRNRGTEKHQRQRDRGDGRSDESAGDGDCHARLLG